MVASTRDAPVSAVRVEPEIEFRAPLPTRLGALDGLRAVAVVAVVVYHFEPGWLPAGYLGVDVFMAVSGFIVTRLLVQERNRTGRIRLGAFWARRFRRLVPALLLLLFVVALWVRLADLRVIAPSVRSQGLAALTYVTNWKLIADGVSYGGDVGGASPLVHLWSLAVEEQFYLVWPALLVGLLVFARGRRTFVAAIVVCAAVASACWMAWLYDPGVDPMRVYYGTDTRAQTFLLGAFAALVAPKVRGLGRRAVAYLGAAALVALLFAMYAAEDGFLYRGGFGLVALGAALAALATTMPGPVTNALDRRPLRAVGRVSYGVYLWHWPAVVLLTPASIGLDGAALTATRLGVTAAGTGASWMLVERPFARAQPRRLVICGGAMTAIACFVLFALPATTIVPFSNVQTDRLQPAVVVAPPSSDGVLSAAPSPSTNAAPNTGTAPSTALPAKSPPRSASSSTDVAAHPAPSTSAVSAPPTTAAPLAPAPLTGLALPPTGMAMIVGDSGMVSGAPALIAGLRAAGWGIVDTAWPGMGLARPDGAVENWSGLAQQHGVDLTIVMIGGWDKPFVQQYGDSAYRGVVEQGVAAFTAGGGKVLWLSTMPGGGKDDRVMDKFFAPLPERYPGAVDYLDIESWLRAPDGTWPEIVNGRRFRGPDGWHLCPDGAVALAHAALGHLGLDRPGWETGAWRADPDYHQPAGICDV